MNLEAKNKLCLEDAIINLIELDQFKPKLKNIFCFNKNDRKMEK